MKPFSICIRVKFSNVHQLITQLFRSTFLITILSDQQETMAGTSANFSGQANIVKGVFEKLTYAPVADADNVAKAWLDDHGRRFGVFIDGKWTQSETGDYIQALNPATGDLLALLQVASEDDISRGLKTSRVAFGVWSGLTPHARARHMYSLARHIQKHQQLLSVIEALDSGQAIREARDIDVPQTVRLFYHYAGRAQLLNSECREFKPYGIVAVLPSWARSLVSLSVRVCAALASGNTVIVCPSPDTSLSALMLADMAIEAGLPAGVLNVLTDNAERNVMNSLVMHEETDKITFVGTTQEGRTLQKLIAGSGKSLTMELSGKSLMIVFENSDLDSVVEGVVDGIWTSQGQFSSAASRLIVQETVADRLQLKLQRRLENLRVGNSLDKSCELGAMTCSWMPKVVAGFVDEARHEGAQIYQAPISQKSPGWFYPPTLVVGAQTSSRIVTEDFVGPVTTLLPFRTAAEAVALANNSAYAMAASIWTENITLALEVAATVQAGTVWINSHNLCDAAAGVGGPKHSGSGRSGGRRGLLEYMQASWQSKPPVGQLDMNLHTFGSCVAPRPSASCLNGENGDYPVVDRTYKLYYGGAQKRPDGQYSRPVTAAGGQVIGHVAEASRKDVRNAVEAAQKAFVGWSRRAGHNRAQILFYLAENLNVRQQEMADRLELMTGQSKEHCQREVDLSVERLFYWAAFCDKYGGEVQEVPLYGRVIESNEAVGVIGVICPESYPLLAFVSLFGAAMARGNAVIIVPSEKHPLAALDFYQIFDTSDLPGGVVNVLSGNSDHLTRCIAEHQDVQAVWYFGSREGSKFVEYASADSLKRMWVNHGRFRYFGDPVQGQGEEWLFHCTQPKTIWTPMGEIFAN